MGQHDVRAEISGIVARFEVEEGGAVTAYQPVMVLEAMKMEIPVESPRSGVLLSYRVAIGELVEEGQSLFSIEE